jgi:hypothetical protein
MGLTDQRNLAAIDVPGNVCANRQLQTGKNKKMKNGTFISFRFVLVMGENIFSFHKIN